GGRRRRAEQAGRQRAHRPHAAEQARALQERRPASGWHHGGSHGHDRRTPPSHRRTRRRASTSEPPDPHPRGGGLIKRHLALVGPTASGKSTLALEAARVLRDVEIVSVDSMQVYRGMDIGTAKPTPEERAEVPHHLLDLAEPDERFTVARFQQE